MAIRATSHRGTLTPPRASHSWLRLNHQCSPPAHTAHTSIPPAPSYAPSSHQNPPSLPYVSPPPKILPIQQETPPPLARATDSITPRTKQWLAQPLATLDGLFNLGWTQYQFALLRRGQLALWQGG